MIIRTRTRSVALALCATTPELALGVWRDGRRIELQMVLTEAREHR